MVDRSRLATLTLILTIAGYPLVAVVAETFVGVEFGRLITVPFRAFVLLTSIALIMCAPIGPGRMGYPIFWAAWWSFWLLYIARMIFDTVLMPVELPQPILEYYLYGIGMTFVPAVALAVGARFLRAERTPNALLMVSGFATALSLVQIFAQRDISSIDVLAASRLESAMLNPISLGHIGATTVLLSSLRLVWGRERNTFYTNVYLCALFAVGLAAVVLGSSRGPVLALVASIGMLALAQRVAITSTVAIAVVAALLAVVTAEGGSQFLIVERVTSGVFNDSAREELLTQAWNAFSAAPIIGAGIDPFASYPHNLIVESFLVNGVISGVLFVAIFISSLWISFGLAASDRSVAWLPALYVQYAAASMFSGNIYGSNIFWCLMAAVVAYRSHHATTASPLASKS